MHRLKQIEDRLICCVKHELEKGVEHVNAEELGEVIDMIKDIEQTMYYCAKVKRMEEKKEEEDRYNYNAPMVESIPYGAANPMSRGFGGYKPEDINESWDELEGHSGRCRKEYLESKHSHMDQNEHKKKLETYAKELGRDILEMIEESTPEEKQIMQQKLSVLANKLK